LNVNEVLDIDSISAQKLPKLKLCWHRKVNQ
jgi:hypothetical protein